VLQGSGLAQDASGALLVNNYLASISHPEVFGGGDGVTLVDNAPPRIGVHAVKQGPILFKNILRLASGRRLCVYRPQKKFLQILNMGEGKGLMVWKNHVAYGLWAGYFKRWLDERFIRFFQGKVKG
jgi:NADH dehydrogenase FAD-containing subunit